jgi:Secretion system C-terminal sorting domain
MKFFKQVLFTLATTLTTLNIFGQANPFINVLPENSGVVAVGCPVDIIVTIGNAGPNSAVPQAKLRPIIQVPPSVTFLPTAQQVGLPTGWTILSNTGSQIRLCNSTDAIPISTSRIIILKVKGVTVTGSQTFSGNINFGNGTTCAPGTSVSGDITTDNSALSTIEVIAAPLLTITSALTQFSTSSGVPSNEQNFTLSGTNITEDIIVSAPTGFEVSNTTGMGFASTAIVTPISGILANYPVYVRLAATTTLGNVSGNVINTSVSPTCVAPQNISVSGAVSANSLSVTLKNFSVQSNNCIAHLNWITASETNSEKFEIEKSDITNDEWKTIGSVTANGNTATNTNYNFKDENIFISNKVIYRLKMIDKDGSFTYSPAIDARIKCDEQGVSVFPNPVVNGKLIVSLNSAENVLANLTSVTGEQIKKIVLKKGMNNIDVSTLSNGVYFLGVKFAEGINQNIKVNIQK